MFDSLKYAKILEDSGLPRNQAETHIRILSDVIGEEMATKTDLEDCISKLDIKTTNQLASFRAEMTSEFSNVKTEFTNVRHDMINLEHRLILKLGGLMAALMTIGLTATQLLS